MTQIYEINELIEFLDKHKINAEQLVYCLLLHHDKRYAVKEGSTIVRPLSQLYKYHNNISNFKRADIEDLIEKGFIRKDGNTLAPDMLEVTNMFIKEYYGRKYKFDQLRDAYPSTTVNFDHPSKPRIPLKIIRDYEKTVEMYNKFVRSENLHEHILDLVEWAKSNPNTVNLSINIENFVSSKYWEYLQELKEEEVESHGLMYE